MESTPSAIADDAEDEPCRACPASRASFRSKRRSLAWHDATSTVATMRGSAAADGTARMVGDQG